MSQKKALPKPVWWKNTYFWISAILLILAIVGLIWSDKAIRDPGQKREGGLVWMYLAASALMFVNGWLSHRQTVQQFEEEVEGSTP